MIWIIVWLVGLVTVGLTLALIQSVDKRRKELQQRVDVINSNIARLGAIVGARYDYSKKSDTYVIPLNEPGPLTLEQRLSKLEDKLDAMEVKTAISEIPAKRKREIEDMRRQYLTLGKTERDFFNNCVFKVEVQEGGHAP